MTKRNSTRIQELIGLLHSLYPPVLAEDWDNVGLLSGDPSAPLERVLISLDVNETTLQEAELVGAQAIISHHPAIFRPLRSITASDSTGRLLMRSIRAGITLISVHTNLDRGTDGLNDWLAAALGLNMAIPLQGVDLPLCKLVVYVPVGHETIVSEALFAAGAGSIGSYDRCSFRCEGNGTFRPGKKSAPFIGTPGEDEVVRESRIEMIVPSERSRRVIDKLLKVHPYEEPAYDLLPLQNRRPDLGLGRIGRLAQPLSLADYAHQVGTALNTSALRLVGDPQRLIAKVAVCGGSGASLIPEAQRQGADLLVTGDLKYHDAQHALDLGIALIDAGHFATEQLMITHLTERLRLCAEERRLPLDIIASTTGHDPFTHIHLPENGKTF